MTALEALVRDFAALVAPAPANTEGLIHWIWQTQEADHPFLCSFTTLPGRDRATVEAALTLPWHNGRTEGANHKIKLIKPDVRPRSPATPTPARPAQLTGLPGAATGYENLGRAERLTVPSDRSDQGHHPAKSTELRELLAGRGASSEQASEAAAGGIASTAWPCDQSGVRRIGLVSMRVPQRLRQGFNHWFTRVPLSDLAGRPGTSGNARPTTDGSGSPVSATRESGSGTDFVKWIVLPCAGDAPSPER
ncbi:hypothetical protein ACIPSJ_49775 [Streptomyces sp. NPDC090088]|uniref:hypothetical protein n=1 Tax=Streptomyces sp. NPDC090088 TaxID=3365944 RepID=UPI0037FBAC76